MSIWANAPVAPPLPTGPVDAVVVGGGPAGYTAAIYLGRARTAPVVLAGSAAGGQLMDTGIVENFPGFPDGIEGPELMARMREQAERAGARVHAVDVTEVRYADEPGALHEVVTDTGVVRTRAVVLATGSAPRTLGLPGEDELRAGGGVAYCAVCEAPLFAGRTVAVVGGGDSAMEEVLALAKHAERVHLLHRRDAFRAAPILLEHVRRLANVEIRTGVIVSELRTGDDGRLTAVELTHDAGRVSVLAVQGLFVAIGHTPRTSLAGRLPLSPTGHLHPTGPGGRTEVPGVFVAGDVADDRFRQAVTAAGDGCAAALETIRHLEHDTEEAHA